MRRHKHCSKSDFCPVPFLLHRPPSPDPASPPTTITRSGLSTGHHHKIRPLPKLPSTSPSLATASMATAPSRRGEEHLRAGELLLSWAAGESP
ncbi:hypothetical protein Drorol1_Dr00008964 [Drosera rotundifolia]